MKTFWFGLFSIVVALYLITGCTQEKKTDIGSEIAEKNRILAKGDAYLAANKFEEASNAYKLAFGDFIVLKYQVPASDSNHVTLETLIKEATAKLDKVASAKQAYEGKLAAEKRAAELKAEAEAKAAAAAAEASAGAVAIEAPGEKQVPAPALNAIKTISKPKETPEQKEIKVKADGKSEPKSGFKSKPKAEPRLESGPESRTETFQGE